jgi:hypothetical protein
MGYSYVIILAIPAVLSIVTGFAMVILVPLWFFRRNSLTAFRKTVVAFALAGLLVPLVVIACIVTKHAEMVSASVLWVWPGIVASATLPHSATSAARGLMSGIGILSNVGLYSWLGLVVGSIWKAGKR